MNKRKNWKIILGLKDVTHTELTRNRVLEILLANEDIYRYWRKTQREQLGVSANLYMIFASAILGYVSNFLIANKGMDCLTKTLLSFGAFSLCFSLFFYARFTHNRLKDFRETSQLLNGEKTEQQASISTEERGELTWDLYDFQRYSLIAGFSISLIGFCIYIYS